ncbi:MAG: DUF1501 domain-containing protein [Deltaproteobacteria bacterium]|nr:DUF1501 domain-containing protein [Deltaproteobacteria bacterium]
MKPWNRRQLISRIAQLSGGILLNPMNAKLLFAEEQLYRLNGRKPFVLYIHMGSSCGIASGLIQPLKAGEWPIGFFDAGKEGESVNPLLNHHIKAEQFILHPYSQPLAEIVQDCFLTNGTAVSLAHVTAAQLQMTGSTLSGLTPQWAAGVAQNCKNEEHKNPILISSGIKSPSVPDLNMINATSLSQFMTITSDPKVVPKGFESTWEAMLREHQIQAIGSTKIIDSERQKIQNLMKILNEGFPEFDSHKESINSLKEALSDTNYADIITQNPDHTNIQMDDRFKNYLILAGSLAKTGLASGMTIPDGSQDLHNGGGDVDTARFAASRWALINLFWKWIKKQGMDQDMLIIVSHEFGRGAYNLRSVEKSITDQNGQTKEMTVHGRDHGLGMGILFINKNVPSGARFGAVAENLTPVPGTDFLAGYNPSAQAFTSSQLIGSMLMRIYPELFPTERDVRKHWPTFAPLTQLIRGN